MQHISLFDRTNDVRVGCQCVSTSLGQLLKRLNNGQLISCGTIRAGVSSAEGYCIEGCVLCRSDVDRSMTSVVQTVTFVEEECNDASSASCECDR